MWLKISVLERITPSERYLTRSIGTAAVISRCSFFIVWLSKSFVMKGDFERNAIVSALSVG